ncbi:MAG: hypothetical protein EOP49_16065, partial [Sphingobacteriales bacterium]
MLRLLFFAFCCCCTVFPAVAQNENSVWAFGYHNGLNFNTNPPTFFQTQQEALEGCSSVADGAGNLLFYSNGNDVWTATGTVMPNGSGILGNGPGIANLALGSCAQGVAIVKSVSNASQYYLFVLDAGEQVTGGVNAPGYLRYSVVDMSLNMGAGDVVAAQKNMILDTFMSEKMTVTKGAGCYYWLVAHRNNSATYRAFKIDFNGINPGVSSTGTWAGDMGAGQLKISPNGTRIATGNSMGGPIELGAFDNATGMVSNVQSIDPLVNQSRIGTCFSPDNSKLYITTMGDLSQYDISTFPNGATIAASKVVLNSGINYAQLRNGPDGKIYVAQYQGINPFIGVISNPNAAGTACNLNNTALPQSTWSQFPAVPGNPFGHTLGNDIVVGVSADTVWHPTRDTLVCSANSIDVAAPPGYNEYLWNDGNTSMSRPINTSGTYWVYSFQNCSIAMDTIRVDFVNLSVNLGPDTSICRGGTMLLHVGNNPGATYRWQDASTDPDFMVDREGTYSVRVTKGACSVKDTIKIGMFDPSLNIPQNDTSICDDETIVLRAVANPMSNYLWNTGSNAEQITVSQPGLYLVTAINACGTFVDSVNIKMQDCRCSAFIPNAFSPNGDGNNDVYRVNTQCAVNQFSLSIYNRFGQRVFQSTSPDKG